MSNRQYSNLLKPEPHETILRYTNLTELILVATRKELPLKRIDLFRDPFEGSIPQSVINQQVVLSGGRAMARQLQAQLPHHYSDNTSYLPIQTLPGDLFA